MLTFYAFYQPYWTNYRIRRDADVEVDERCWRTIFEFMLIIFRKFLKRITLLLSFPLEISAFWNFFWRVVFGDDLKKKSFKIAYNLDICSDDASRSWFLGNGEHWNNISFSLHNFRFGWFFQPKIPIEVIVFWNCSNCWGKNYTIFAFRLKFSSWKH